MKETDTKTEKTLAEKQTKRERERERERDDNDDEKDIVNGLSSFEYPWCYDKR